MALLVVVVASAATFVPQFSNRIVGTVAAPGSQTGPNGGTGWSGPAASGTPVPGGRNGPNASVGPQATARPVVAGGAACAAGRNGGSTAPGVTATEIHIATTDVTTGVGSGFLGEATQGMQAAINEANSAGGICGRRVVLDPPVNSGWSRADGAADIANFINSGNVFALVGEPDSEGLAGAIDSHSIDNASIPVVGTDGMLNDQYSDPWVWPVAASTVTNMHIIAEYAVDTLKAKSFGIVYDVRYKFGFEGAEAFANELHRLGKSLDTSGGCGKGYCGISSDNQTGGYSSEITAFDGACSPCDVVVLLLEPGPAETWMKGEEGASNPWYHRLMGGEPLFDDGFGSTCAGDCAAMTVWTGYRPAIPPFDSQKPVYTFAQSLQRTCPSCDPHNEFTEGAYLGTKLFVAACQAVGPTLTRQALRDALNGGTFDFGLSVPLSFAHSHIANNAMAAFSDNASGSFNHWDYASTGFLTDPATGKDQ